MMKAAGLLTLICSWSMAHGQQAEQKMALAMKQNQIALQQYTWKSQTQIRKDGEIKATKLFSSRYAANGEVVQLLLEEQSAKAPKFGIRGMVAKKKKEEAMELIDGLQRFAKSYAELPAGKMQEIMKTAKVMLEGKSLRLESANVLQPDDSMTIWLDATTRRQRRIEINSSYDAKPVRIVTEFKDLPDGPTYLARSVVEYPGEKLTLTMENFGYEPVAREEEALLTIKGESDENY